MWNGACLGRLMNSRKFSLFFKVHRATLIDGREAAVKVQHKKVKKHAFADAVVIEVRLLIPNYRRLEMCFSFYKIIIHEKNFLYW